MIRVERGAAPDFVDEAAFMEARTVYERFRSEGGARSKQVSSDFTSALGPYLARVTEYAYLLFNTKCAYSEVVVAPHLHLHRPEGDAYDDHLTGAPNHYWWTAFWYRNWYHVSADVASLKRNIFPVIGARAPEPTDGRPLHDDLPEQFLDRGVLIDPCEDDPQLHLRFTDDGLVSPWAEQSASWLTTEDARRGPETIKVLDLNARTLIASRLQAIGPSSDLADLSPEGVQRLVHPQLPHLGAFRQVIAARLLEAGSERLTDSMRLVAPELVPFILTTPSRFGDGLVAELRTALRQSHAGLAELLDVPAVELRRAAMESVRSPSPERPAGRRTVITRTAAITRILITNFQAIETCDIEVPPAVETPRHLDPAHAAAMTAPLALDVPTAGFTGRPWRVFLGENGSGKSSALRALALALAGDDVDALVETCGLDWSDLLRRGAQEGRVLLEFTGGDVIDLTFTAKGPTARSRANLARVESFVRGFGATRLKSDLATGTEASVRLGNLFDPLQPVVDAQQWLLQLEGRADKGDFNVAAVAIARLLNRQDQVVDTGDPKASRFITRVGQEIRIADEPLRTLSDGYRAIITLACDLMAGAGSGLSDMRNASGIVLIDELGCYLHPRWKMQITRTLRDVFPSMQFVVTTHEPLCLRGLVEREVVRVTRSSTRLGEPWKAMFDVIEESPSKYRVDRLLTSSFFSLDTTIDPEVETEFQQYYALVRRTDLSPDEDQLRRQLRARLSQHGILGYTARDQLVYDAIDEFLATSGTLDPERRRQERRKTLDNVIEIWRGVAAKRDAAPS